MAGVPKQQPIDAFEANFADARQLVKLVECFTNKRTRRMRRELRDHVGNVLRIKRQDRAQLDCLQSNDAFLTFLPGSRLNRSDFEEMRPLLRQAIVAACAATETYVGDKVMQRVGPLMKNSSVLTRRLAELPLNLGDWMAIEDRYERRRRGLREHVVEPFVREHSSTAPSQIGVMLSLIGVSDWSKKVDTARKVAKGDTISSLERITKRRNRIAHTGDRVGRGRANLTVNEVNEDLAVLESIVRAIDDLF